MVGHLTAQRAAAELVFERSESARKEAECELAEKRAAHTRLWEQLGRATEYSGRLEAKLEAAQAEVRRVQQEAADERAAAEARFQQLRADSREAAEVAVRYALEHANQADIGPAYWSRGHPLRAELAPPPAPAGQVLTFTRRLGDFAEEPIALGD